MSDVPRTASVVALSPLLVLTIGGREFDVLLREQPAIMRKVLRSLGERIAADAG